MSEPLRPTLHYLCLHTGSRIVGPRRTLLQCLSGCKGHFVDCLWKLVEAPRVAWMEETCFDRCHRDGIPSTTGFISICDFEMSIYRIPLRSCPPPPRSGYSWSSTPIHTYYGIQFTQKPLISVVFATQLGLAPPYTEVHTSAMVNTAHVAARGILLASDSSKLTRLNVDSVSSGVGTTLPVLMEIFWDERSSLRRRMIRLGDWYRVQGRLGRRVSCDVSTFLR